MEKNINKNLSFNIRIHPKVLWQNLREEMTEDISKLLPNLAMCFDEPKLFYGFLENCCQVEKESLLKIMIPKVDRNLLTPYFCYNSSPAQHNALIFELTSKFGYSKALAESSLRELRKQGAIDVKDEGIYPLNLNKTEAVAHILTEHANGLPWLDIAKLVNQSGCCNSIIDENRLIANYTSDSEYLYQSDRGTYRHLKYLDISRCDIPTIMKDIRQYFETADTESIHLNDYYQQAKEYIRSIEYFEFRHIVRAFCSDYGLFFNGKSGVDGLGLNPQFEKTTQQMLIVEIMNKAKGALTKQEIAAKLRSKSLGHASFYLDKMMAEGEVVRVDNMMYTTPKRAFKNIDTELILDLIDDIICGNGIVEADAFREHINRELNLSYPKQFYAALATVNMQEYGWHKSHNIFSYEEIPYKSLYQICQTVCDPILPNSENMMRLKKFIFVTEEVASSAFHNWKFKLLENKDAE